MTLSSTCTLSRRKYPDSILLAKSVFLFINQKVYCAEWKLSICIYQNQAYLQVKGTIMSLKSPEQKSGHLVLPGERLGVIEEFIPDSGTFVKDGVIFSKIVGRSLMDLQTRRVSVYPVVERCSRSQSRNCCHRANRQRPIRQCSSENIQDWTQKNSQAISAVFCMFQMFLTGTLTKLVTYVSQATSLRAKVISDKNQVFHLSMNDKGLGVLYGFCSRCGTLLEQHGYDLKCPKDGNVETRKISPDYGKEQI